MTGTVQYEAQRFEEEKRDIIIWGYNDSGKYIADKLIEDHERVVCIVDNDLRYEGARYANVPVCSYEAAKKKYFGSPRLCVLITAKRAESIFQIIDIISEIECNYIGIVKPRVQEFDRDFSVSQFSKEISWYKFDGERFSVIPRIEINLIDGCNLNCKGCTHFSSIFSREDIYNLEEYENDLKSLREIGEIVRLRLLGGEPLLLNNIEEYIRVARNVCPESDIEIITNGTLVLRMQGVFFDTLRECDACLLISPYKPVMEYKDEIMAKAKLHNCNIKYEKGCIEVFSRQLTLENNHDKWKAASKCSSRSCTFLRKGKLYKCPFDGLINEFYEFYGIDKKLVNGFVIRGRKDVYSHIKSLAMQPVELCSYCSEEPEMILWSVQANPKLEEWLYYGI